MYHLGLELLEECLHRRPTYNIQSGLRAHLLHPNSSCGATRNLLVESKRPSSDLLLSGFLVVIH